jgi:hypothetical protein
MRRGGSQGLRVRSEDFDSEAEAEAVIGRPPQQHRTFRCRLLLNHLLQTAVSSLTHGLPAAR